MAQRIHRRPAGGKERWNRGSGKLALVDGGAIARGTPELTDRRADPPADADANAFADADLPEHAGISSDAGMSTVEYAVGTVVAAAFAAVLYKIVTGDSVIAGLTTLINTALHSP